MNLHLTAPVPAMRDLGAEIPPVVEGIVRRCLRKRPEERYPDAAALLHDLEHWRELAPEQFVFADEDPMPPAEEHLLLLVAGIAVGFLAFSVLFIAVAYLLVHH
jgi:hypothetical protein